MSVDTFLSFSTGGLLLMSVVVSTICVIVVAVVKKCRGKVFLLLPSTFGGS